MHGGGGEGNRKGVPLELEQNKPLSSVVNKPPPVAVSEAAAAATMSGEVDNSHRDPRLQSMPDRELAETISRLKSSLKLALKDGGEKLQASLKNHQAEAERRKLLKADNKFQNANPLSDKSTCTNVTDDFESRGVPPSVSASQSELATRSCSNLEKKRPINSFSKELPTLQRCAQKRKNVPFLSPRTRKICLSSRQSPFKSPKHISAHTNDLAQSQSHSSSLSPRQSDTYSSGNFEKKEIAPRFQPMRNSKRNNQRTFVLVDEEDEELEVDEENQGDLVAQRSNETKIYYPSRDDPEVVVISYSDMEYLAPESYLSSTIMNFYIQYLQNPTSPRTRKRCGYHFFNTYFYNKLKQDVSNKLQTNKETSFVKFRRWWKGVNIFEKAYIFIPIHENLHWSLIIICIPNKADESGPIILHMDSLGLHCSKSILSDVKSFLIEEWKFLREKKVPLEFPIPDNIWEKIPRRIDEKVIEVPQQKNEYDCGLFVLFFMERFLEEAPERLKKKDLDMFGKQWFKPEEASSLRVRISSLLGEEFKDANGGTGISD